jgi:hypothetical protein
MEGTSLIFSLPHTFCLFFWPDSPLRSNLSFHPKPSPSHQEQAGAAEFAALLRAFLPWALSDYRGNHMFQEDRQTWIKDYFCLITWEEKDFC